MSHMLAVGKQSAFFAVLAFVLAACEREQPVSPRQNERTPESPYTTVGEECQQTCSIITNSSPLRAAAVPSDTVGSIVELAKLEVAGTVGSIVSLSLDVDTTVFTSSSLSARRVLVTVDGASTQYLYSEVMNGVTIYRFSSSKTVSIRYALPREFAPVPDGRIELVQKLDAKTRIVRSQRPWVNRAITPSTLLPPPISSFSVTGPGNYSGVDVAFFDYYPGNPFGEFQNPPGTGASAPITITFSAPVRDISVCIADPDFAGNTLTVNMVSGSSTTYAFASDGTPGTYSVSCIPTADTQVTSILLTPAAADYVAYFGLNFAVGDVNFTVDCSPPPSERGVTITCTAQPTDPSATLAVTSWSFTSETGVRVDRTANVHSSSWAGTLIVGGTVLAEGTIGGAPSTGSTTVQVTTRSWSGRVTQKSHAVVPTTFTSRPSAFSELGLATFSLPLDQNVTRWLKTITDEGPNQDFAYLIDLPPIPTTESQVNTNAMNDTSSFYKAQEKQNKNIKGVLYCGRSVVPGVLLDLSKKHEGAVPDPDVYPNSHPAIFRRHVDTVAVKRYEPLFGFGDIQGLSSITQAIRDEAINDSQAMHTDGRNYINTITLGGCDQFHFTYGK